MPRVLSHFGQLRELRDALAQDLGSIFDNFAHAVSDLHDQSLGDELLVVTSSPCLKPAPPTQPSLALLLGQMLVRMEGPRCSGWDCAMAMRMSPDEARVWMRNHHQKFTDAGVWTVTNARRGVSVQRHDVPFDPVIRAAFLATLKECGVSLDEYCNSLVVRGCLRSRKRHRCEENWQQTELPFQVDRK